MGKILYPKQRTQPDAMSAPEALTNHSTAGGLNGDTMSKGNETMSWLSSGGGETRRVLSADRQAASGGVLILACPECQQCFRSYASVNHHRRTVHGQRMSTASGSSGSAKGLLRRDALPPLLSAADLALNVAYNMLHCIHGKRAHLLTSPSPSPSTPNVSSNKEEVPEEILGEMSVSMPALDACEKQFEKNVKELPIVIYDDDPLRTQPEVMHLEAVQDDASHFGNDTPPVLIEIFQDDSSSSFLAYPIIIDTPPVLQKCIDYVKPPPSYDEPGPWKYICMVCRKVFANKSSLHVHQDAIHSHVVCTHLEVESDSSLLMAGGTISCAVLPTVPTAALHARGKPLILGKSPPLCCTVCSKKYRSTRLLHGHVVACIASSNASSASIPRGATVTASYKSAPQQDTAVWHYGKSRRYRKKQRPA